MIIVLIYVEGYIQVHTILHNSHYPAFSVVNYGANVQKIYDMKKFSYKKMVDSLTFHRLSTSECPGLYYDLSVSSIATHPALQRTSFLSVFDCNYPYAVAMVARSFLSSIASSDTPSALDFYHDGKLYTWHIDRYNHIIFRIYRVVK